MANKIQLRRGTFANLPTLSVGEPAFCTDTKQLFIGDGTNNIDLSAAHITGIYSASKTYATWEYCIHNNLLYRCTAPINVPEEWNAGKWSLTTLSNELLTQYDYTWGVSKNFFVQSCKVVYNPVTKEVRITLFCNSSLMATESAVLGLPVEIRPTVDVPIHNGVMAKRNVSLAVADWNPVPVTVCANGQVVLSFITGTEPMCYFNGTFSYIAV